MRKKAASPAEPLIPTDIPIREIRGQRVLLDSDLATIYGVSTSALNQAVKRNLQRFPADFMWQLTAEEFDSLRSQIVTLRPGRGQHRKFLPYAFTEHGALQAANILKSERAAAMSVYVIRAFVQMREQLMADAQILRRLAEMDRKLLEHDGALVGIWNRLKPLLTPPPPKPKPRIGFKP
jgi:hypothetical protein